MDVCGRGSQSRIITGTVRWALNSALQRDQWVPCCGFGAGASWDLTLTLTLPRTGTLQGNLSLPRTLTLQLSRHLEWTLTSAIEGGHETGVDSALVTYLD